MPGELFDYEAVHNIDPLGTDFCVRFREGMRHWNMTVQWWLAHYIHRRAPRSPPVLRYATGSHWEALGGELGALGGGFGALGGTGRGTGGHWEALG